MDRIKLIKTLFLVLLQCSLCFAPSVFIFCDYVSSEDPATESILEYLAEECTEVWRNLPEEETDHEKEGHIVKCLPFITPIEKYDFSAAGEKGASPGLHPGDFLVLMRPEEVVSEPPELLS